MVYGCTWRFDVMTLAVSGGCFVTDLAINSGMMLAKMGIEQCSGAKDKIHEALVPRRKGRTTEIGTQQFVLSVSQCCCRIHAKTYSLKAKELTKS